MVPSYSLDLLVQCMGVAEKNMHLVMLQSPFLAVSWVSLFLCIPFLYEKTNMCKHKVNNKVVEENGGFPAGESPLQSRWWLLGQCIVRGRLIQIWRHCANRKCHMGKYDMVYRKVARARDRSTVGSPRLV